MTAVGLGDALVWTTENFGVVVIFSCGDFLPPLPRLRWWRGNRSKDGKKNLPLISDVNTKFLAVQP